MAVRLVPAWPGIGWFIFFRVRDFRRFGSRGKVFLACGALNLPAEEILAHA